MAQKYKVFVESNTIVFTDLDLGLPNWKGVRPTSFSDLVQAFRTEVSFQVLAANPKKQMHSFFATFKKIDTAGGLVQQQADETFLWIQRLGHLDLPKGKIEKGEEVFAAAIREIEEETSLSGNFSLVRELPNTYHVYHFKNRSIWKANHWFYLKYNGSSEVKPQIEEDISAVFWLKESEWKQQLHETYPGLQEMLTENF